MKNGDISFHEIKGWTVLGVDISDQSFELKLRLGNASKLVRVSHWQDCCERVRIERTEGDFRALVGNVITSAFQDHCNEPKWFAGKYEDDSHTWTMFKIVDDKENNVLVWFLGESNGYYGESTETTCFEIE